MSLRIRQIVLAAKDLETTVNQLTRLLDVDICYRDPEVAKFGLANALLLIGDQFLEVVSPIEDNTAAGRHLQRHGDSGYMLILQTDDLIRDQKRFDELGVRSIWESNRADIRAVHLHPKDIGGAIVSIDQPAQVEAWPWAGSQWQTIRRAGGAQKVMSTTIGAVDPKAMANRWARVLGSAAPVSRNDEYFIEIDRGELLFRPAKTDVLTEFKLVVTDLNQALRVARELGLETQDNRVSVCGTSFILSTN
jgi:hypothetical protein